MQNERDAFRRSVTSILNAGKEVLLLLAFACLLAIPLLDVGLRLSDAEISFDMELRLHEGADSSELSRHIEARYSESATVLIQCSEVPSSANAHGGEQCKVGLAFHGLYGLLGFNWNSILGGGWGIVGFSGHWSYSEVPAWLVVFTVHFALVPYLLFRLLLAQWKGRSSLLVLKVPGRRFWLFASVFLGAVLAFLVSLLGYLGVSSGFFEVPGNVNAIQPLLIGGGMVLLTATLLAITGLIEELVFRGLLLEPFRRQGLILLGSALTTFWFVVAHMPIVPSGPGGLFYIGTMIVAGSLLAVISLRSGSWLYAGFVHASYNFCMTLFMVWFGVVPVSA